MSLIQHRTQKFVTISRNRGARKYHAWILSGSLILIGTAIVVVFVFMAQLQVSTASTNTAEGPKVTADEMIFNTVKLYAPRTRLSRGTKLSINDLREVPWPKDQIPADAVQSIYDVQDMYTRVALVPGQPIIKDYLTAVPVTGGLAEHLRPGDRAVTIRVDAISGIEGWARPGAHVDVYVTYTDNARNATTRVVVENAIVLSYAGQTSSEAHMERKAKRSRVNGSSTVTLAVSSSNSLKIQTASAMGRLTLALRGSNDRRSGGKEVFQAHEWNQSKPQASSGFIPSGFAKVGEKTFVLDSESNWHTAGDIDG